MEFSNINQNFWQGYYKNNTHDIAQNSSFSSFVYDEYIQKYNNANVLLKIADVGCGNCRDSFYFGLKKNMCYSIDINVQVNEDTRNSNCRIIKEDAEDFLKNNKLQTLVDVVYMRWFLHAMPYMKAKNIFKYALNNLKSGGLICLEVRSLNDLDLIKNSKYNIDDESYETTHKRWLYTPEMLLQIVTEHNCEILYCKEDYFSPNENTETANPLLIRIICKKRILPYYEQSENHIKYKHILPRMKEYTMCSYTHMDIMNNILEKHNIKYVAVAGTALGLSRHGGIIPWDNDIDIGFINSEWIKLFSIQDELKKAGLIYKTNGINHCHFGNIDCFKLDFKQNSFDGDAKTYCHVDEYRNVSKQIFGYTYIYAPICSFKSLSRRYGNYFYEGDVNDNFHFKDNSVKRFKLNYLDLSYQIK
jgi:hypothetical protein